MSSTLNIQIIKQLEGIFKRFDMNADGNLTQLELAAMLRSLGLEPLGDHMNTLSSTTEIKFEKFIEAIIPAIEKKVMVEVFRLFDRDGKGYITISEFTGAMRRMGHRLSYHELSYIMREADANGDGVICFNEFAAIMGRSAAEFFKLK